MSWTMLTNQCGLQGQSKRGWSQPHGYVLLLCHPWDAHHPPISLYGHLQLSSDKLSLMLVPNLQPYYWIIQFQKGMSTLL